MNGDDGRPIDALARAVLDGEPVDWGTAESAGGDAGRLARHLKLVAAIAHVYRQNRPPASALPPDPHHKGAERGARRQRSHRPDGGLSEGLILELNRRLAQVRELGVRSAMSSLAYKGKPRDAGAFARELGVNHVLEGSVFADGSAIRRISASLVRVADGQTVWSESFVPDQNDVFAVQERIALAIVGSLRLRFEGGSAPIAWIRDCRSCSIGRGPSGRGAIRRARSARWCCSKRSAGPIPRTCR